MRAGVIPASVCESCNDIWSARAERASYSERAMSGKNAVVLLSGGLDSTTVLAIARSEGFVAVRAELRYGQRHAAELEAARRIARGAGVAGHVVAEIDLRVFGGSALTADIDVPKGRSDDEMGARHPDHLRAGAQHDLPLVRAGLGRDAGRERHLRRRQRARLQRLSGLPAGVHRGLRADGEPGHQGRRRGHAAADDPRAADAAHEGGHHPPRARARRRLLGHARVATTPTREGRACGACDACLLRLRGFAAAGVPDPGAVPAGRGGAR